MIPISWFLFVMCPGTGSSQTTPQRDPSLEIEKILNLVRTGMNNSDEQIERGNYHQAQNGTETSIESLSILLDLFMPLTERIKVIWEKEKEIVSQTERLPTDTARLGKETLPEIEKLITTQHENIDSTQRAVDSIVQHLKQGSNTNNQTDQNRQQSQKELMDRVENLLRQAKTHQSVASDFLVGHEMKPALQAEIKAEKKLKEALDAFQNQQQKNRQQQQNEQSQQNGNKKQPQGKTPKDSQESNRNPGKSTEKPGTTSKSEKKLSPQEALKELYRLRKEADAEKKRREKAAGMQAIPGRVPIEKDW